MHINIQYSLYQKGYIQISNLQYSLHVLQFGVYIMIRYRYSSHPLELVLFFLISYINYLTTNYLSSTIRRHRDDNIHPARFSIDIDINQKDGVGVDIKPRCTIQ